MKLCLKNTTGQIGRFVWEVINRKGEEKCSPATVGIEEHEPGCRAELSIRILRYWGAHCCKHKTKQPDRRLLQ